MHINLPPLLSSVWILPFLSSISTINLKIIDQQLPLLHFIDNTKITQPFLLQRWGCARTWWCKTYMHTYIHRDDGKTWVSQQTHHWVHVFVWRTHFFRFSFKDAHIQQHAHVRIYTSTYIHTYVNIRAHTRTHAHADTYRDHVGTSQWMNEWLAVCMCMCVSLMPKMLWISLMLEWNIQWVNHIIQNLHKTHHVLTTRRLLIICALFSIIFFIRILCKWRHRFLQARSAWMPQ